MKKTLFIALLVLISCSSSNETEIVNDFVFMSINDLTVKYGQPHTEYLTNGAEWKLENDLTITVFYEDETLTEPQVIRFKNLDVDSELFYDDFGWDLPHLDWQQTSGKMKITQLHGIKEATFHKGANTLSIELDNPDSSTFGIRQK